MKEQHHNYDPLNRYTMKTRIGNWSEEWDLQETKRKQYLRKKNQGISTVTDKERILMRSLQTASISYPSDGLRHFGDHVMLFNGKVQGFMVTDIFQRLNNTEESYNVSLVKSIHACARSVFVVERVNPKDGFKGDVVHYGQQVRIRINPLLINKPIYLYSEPSSINRYSKVSRLQEVILMLKENFNTVWIFEHPDPNQRLEMVGHPIRADDSVLLKHQMTNQWLAGQTKPYQNTFGQQFQVLAHNFLVNNKSQNLIQERRGFTTIDTPSRAQKQENLWLVMGASNPEQQFDETAVKNTTLSKNSLDKKLKHLLTQRGIYGIRFLHKVFKCLDKQNKGCIDEADFRWSLQSGKIFISEQQATFVIGQYRNGSLVNYRQFLNDLRGKLNKQRYESMIEAFNRVKKIVGNKITLEDLGKVFDAQRHPQVLTHKKSQKDAFNEFIWSWDNIKPDYVIQFEEFAAYFQDLSAMIPRDEHFEYMLLNVFHL